MTMQDELGVDQLDSLITILELIRSGRATTKPEIARTTGYGRALVAQRVMSLMSLGLVAAGDTHIEGRGRAPRTLHLSADSGVLLLTELGTSRTDVCVSDLDGRHLASWSESRDIHQSPESLLENLAVVFERLLDESSRTRLDVWGVGIGVPAPVEYATGRASGSAIMPNWEGFSAREFLSSRFGAPTWVDNDVNLMALGEFRLGSSDNVKQALYVKIGTGIGCGVISEGRLHRGAQGTAGDIAHIEVEQESQVYCQCGQRGCLEAIAGGVALTTAAEQRAVPTLSPILANKVRGGDPLTIADLVSAAGRGDPLAKKLFTSSARAVGAVMASIVNFHNPSQVVLGGTVAHSSDAYLAAVREEIFRRSLPLATRNLQVRLSEMDDSAGLLGAALMVRDELFTRSYLTEWLRRGTPRLDVD